MMTIEKVMENLRKANYNMLDEKEVSDIIIECFGEYEYEGENMIQTTYNWQDDNTCIWQAYVDHKDAPIVKIELCNGLLEGIDIV